MTNRRKFIMQSSLAATAIVAANPINALSKYSSSISGPGFNFNSITLLHTTGTDVGVAAQVKKITSKTTSVVMLHAGKDGEPQSQNLHYDVTHQSLNENHEEGYKIIYKDNIKVGVIAVNAHEHYSTNQINDLANRLKREKDCHLVVCISDLGYKNKNNTDDFTLAGKSEYIDIIVGKHGKSSPKYPMVIHNKNKAEVIVQHITNIESALGKVKIGFNDSGGKVNISF